MRWMRERDALIAQTLAFVQSVTGKRSAGEPSPPVVPEPAPTPTPPAEMPPPAFSAIAEAPKSPPDPASPTPQSLPPSDFQRELESRIASFRAHQERFNREREEYFKATLARLRASIKDGPPPGPRA